MLKLNLGCGHSKLDGYVGVDMNPPADVIHNLEEFPWPWEDNSVDEIALTHVLEHLGQQPVVFTGIMKEMYRVCCVDAKIHIRVPHPRSDNFLGDPTHVRPITPDTMALFSKERNLEWQRDKRANTPLALIHGVDFELVYNQCNLSEPYATQYAKKIVSENRMQEMVKTLNNIADEIQIELRVVK